MGRRMRRTEVQSPEALPVRATDGGPLGALTPRRGVEATGNAMEARGDPRSGGHHARWTTGQHHPFRGGRQGLCRT